MPITVFSIRTAFAALIKVQIKQEESKCILDGAISSFYLKDDDDGCSLYRATDYSVLIAD